MRAWRSRIRSWWGSTSERTRSASWWPRSARTGRRDHRHRNAASSGLRKGTVVNIDATVDAIRKAVDEAELMAGCEIRSVVAGLGGEPHQGHQQPRRRARSRSREVGGERRRARHRRGAGRRAPDRSRGPARPAAGIRGRRPGRHPRAHRHEPACVSRRGSTSSPAAISSGQNLIKCCNRAGLRVRDVLGGPLAAAEAVLTPEERELGVALIDVGAGTTSTVVVATPARSATPRCCRSAAATSPTISRPRCARRSPKPSAEAALRLGAGHRRRRPTRRSRCPASADGRRTSSRSVRSPRSSSRAPRRCSRSCAAEHRAGRTASRLLTSGVVLTGGGAVLRRHGGARRARLSHARAARSAASSQRFG